LTGPVGSSSNASELHFVGAFFESQSGHQPFLLEIFSHNSENLYWRFSVATAAIFTGDFQSQQRQYLLEIFSYNSSNLYWRFSVTTAAIFTEDFQLQQRRSLLEIFSHNSGNLY
jgi:hypothetical protein